VLSRKRSDATDHYDLVVIGGGTGGLISARVGAGIGARVALVERGRLGGDCLWTGCVPSKSLLAAAELAHRMRHADRVGLTPVAPEIDFSRVMDHVRAAQRIIAPQDSAQRLSRDGIDVVIGDARFVSPGAVEVAGRRLRFRKAIIATGSHPALPPVPGLDDVAPLTSDSVWDLQRAPGALAVLGGGAVGCELAQGFARLGSRVTLLERDARLLHEEEPRAGELIADLLADEGIQVRCNARARAVRPAHSPDPPGAGTLELELPEASQTVDFDRILIAAGRAPSTSDLGLEAAGVVTDARGHVGVDGRLRTSARHIYAVGDVTGAMAFTHVAAYHARVATVNALFAARRRVEYGAVPRVCFTDPPVARVGLTAAQAQARWGDTTVTSFDYAELDRAITDGRTEGFATLIGDPKGRLVGATIAAAGAAESIAELTAWIALGAKLDRVSQTVHAYPTLSEGPSRVADERLRARYATPRVQYLARGALRALAAVDRPG
jgi:pyruvate/2-oxoglutarate dehydrogenase complex dihydrolipoamide dehydrogenase (E3) component